MKYEYIKFEGKRYCNVYVDNTYTNGVLRCSHEIDVTFVAEDGEWKFNGAWHIGVEDSEWNANEEDSFEQTFPGLLTDMRKGLALCYTQ